MQLEDLCNSIEGFSGWKHAEKIRFFAWHLQTFGQQKFFSAAQIAKCFKELNIAQPSLVGPFLTAMVNRNPPEAIRGSQGYRLERRIQEALDSRYGKRRATIHVHKLLSELPDRIPSLAQKDYLQEALTCFRYRAFRAAIVMCWNLAYDHLCEVVISNHLNAFNVQLPKSFPKAELAAVAKKEDFAELKESQVLQVCRSSLIVSGSLHKILKEKLDRRNIAAHPSGVTISEPTAEEFIKDLVENVVLKLV
jgi:hypothetical protein